MRALSRSALPPAPSPAMSGALPTPTASAANWLGKASSWKTGPTARRIGVGVSYGVQIHAESSLPAPGAGEGGGEVGDSSAPASTHLTLPSLRDGPLPL